jgi:hypothetical protein
MNRETATLHGYGRLPWSALVAALAAVPAAWADYHGFHLGQAPSQPPPYTHLWAWTPGWLLRGRIDGAHVIAAVLQMDGTIPSGLTPRSSPQQVSYVHRLSRTWPGAEKRVGPISPDLADRAVHLYEVGGEYPVTFVRLEPR